MEHLFILGIVAHLFVDWFLQNEWQADNKVNLRHPAAYVHSGLHTLALLLVFPWPCALGLGVSHLLIDTRKPLVWWRTLIGQTQFRVGADPMRNQAAMHVAFWQDQAAHILLIALAAELCAR